MKKLNALALSAVLLPALSLGSMAFAADDDDRMHGDEQRGGEMQSDDAQAGGMQGDDQRAGERYLSGKPAGGFHADDLIGSTVKHRGSDEDIGEVQDLIIGDDGRIVGVVVQTGGFLGLGGQNVGLGWDQLEHTQEDDETVFYVDMEEDALREAPEYEQDQD